MKRKAILTALVLVGSMTLSHSDEKVTIRHNGKIICISPSALSAHLAHGDAIMVYYQGEWITQDQNREELAALEKDYEEVGAESADVEGEEDEEEY